MIEYEDKSYAVYEYGRMDEETNDVNTRIDGYVFTKNGVVEVAAWAPHYEPGTDGMSIIRFLHGGRHHQRRYKKMYSRRYIVTLAKRFAREIVEGYDE